MMLKKELERVFALSFEISEYKEKNGLPRYLTTGRKMYKASYPLYDDSCTDLFAVFRNTFQ